MGDNVAGLGWPICQRGMVVQAPTFVGVARVAPSFASTKFSVSTAKTACTAYLGRPDLLCIAVTIQGCSICCVLRLRRRSCRDRCVSDRWVCCGRRRFERRAFLPTIGLLEEIHQYHALFAATLLIWITTTPLPYRSHVSPAIWRKLDKPKSHISPRQMF